MKQAVAQLEFDFNIPCHDPITPAEAARALSVPVKEIYDAIYEGRLAATSIASDGSNMAAFRIPRQNLINYVVKKYSDELFFKFPAADPLTVPRVARALYCSEQHIINQVRNGEFPNALNVASDGSAHDEFRIPLCDLVAFVNRRREGAWGQR
jgi:hypothetical protein